MIVPLERTVMERDNSGAGDWCKAKWATVNCSKSLHQGMEN
jgi:hypothetical protein